MSARGGFAETCALHLLACVEEHIRHGDGVEDVILHPRAERDVPSAPVFVDRF